jgi:hypothetical protein
MTSMAQLSPLARAALDYAGDGMPVFPLTWTDAAGRCSCGVPRCPSPGKHPLTPHGFKDATTDARLIEDWWRNWPRANIGIPTGPTSGLYVVDIDSTTDAGRRLAADLARDAYLSTSTTMVQTPGKPPDYVPGLHLWLTSDAEQATVSIGVGELKGRGGYVLAPPSARAGRPYRFRARERLTVADPLTWTRDLLAAFDVALPARAPARARGDGWAAAWLRTALPVGQRRAPDGLPAIVGYLRGKRIDCETAIAILELWDAQNPDPLGTAEVCRHVEGMYGRYHQPAAATRQFCETGFRVREVRRG